MPIKVVCQCGAAFAAPDQYAGKTVKCPKCANPLVVPRPAPTAAPAPVNSSLAELLDEAGIGGGAGQRCPKCQAKMPPTAVICTECGFNTQTGAIVATAVKRGKSDGHGGAAEAVLARAAEELAKGPTVETEQTTSGVLAGYLMSFGLLVVAVVTIGLAYLGFMKIESTGNSQYYAGIVMVVVGVLMQLTSHVVLVVQNFKAGTVHGVVSLVIPIYAPIYGALSGHGFWAFLWFMGSFFANVGGGMVIWFAGGPSESVTMAPRPPAAYVVSLGDMPARRLTAVGSP